MTRLDKLLGSIRKKDKIIEIGASYNPAAPKRKGWNVRVLDHCTKDELIEKYRSMHLGTKYHARTFDISQIEEVDYVWLSGSLESAVPKEEHGTFDACIASHVIEHTPDFVGFIRSLEILLKPNGIITLAVPDKRYCFDYFQPLSTTGNILDALGSSRHTRGKVFNSTAYLVLQNQKTTWGPGPIGKLDLAQNLRDCYENIREYKGNPHEPYIDCHAWFFTPNSFRLVLSELAQLGLINCHIYLDYPTSGPEFFVTLKMGLSSLPDNQKSNYERLDALISTQIDLLEQSSYNPGIRLSLKCKLNFFWLRLKETLATTTWLEPLYQVYLYYYRDRPFYVGSTGAKPSWKQRFLSFWTAFIYIVRRYHYQLTIRTSMASRWRHLGSTSVTSVDYRILKPLAITPKDTVLFVTYHPQGFLSEHVRHFVAHFKRKGMSVILIKVVDDMNHPLVDSSIPEVDAALVRKNAGHDFGAWAHTLHLFPKVYEGKTLWLVNDSVFGPANAPLFDSLLDRINSSNADFVTLTESGQYTPHGQSYFIIFRNLFQHSNTIQKYWNELRNIRGRLNVIFEYELELKHYFSSFGLRCSTLFPVTEIAPGQNPTFHGWRQLLNAGFPFMKIALLKSDVTDVDNTHCRESFCKLGYDSKLIDQHLRSANRIV